MSEVYTCWPIQMAANWTTCQKTAQGCSLDSLDPSNSSVFSAGQVCNQGSVPPYYIDVRSVSDIQAGLQFANATGTPLTIKNTGHDYQGRSSAPGSLALWTHNIRPDIKLAEDFVPDGCQQSVGNAITFGAGQQFGGLYKFANENNLTIIGGISSTVGTAGGWIAGGTQPNFQCIRTGSRQCFANQTQQFSPPSSPSSSRTQADGQPRAGQATSTHLRTDKT